MKRAFDEKPKDAALMSVAIRGTWKACLANNCPMPGSISPSSSGNDFVCRFHDAAKPHDWPRVTEEIIEWLARQKPAAVLESELHSPAYWQARIREIQASPKPGPKDWAAKYVARAEAGEYCQADMLAAAKRIAGHHQREPGEEG